MLLLCPIGDDRAVTLGKTRCEPTWAPGLTADAARMTTRVGLGLFGQLPRMAKAMRKHR
jgi:hypothetical protein